MQFAAPDAGESQPRGLWSVMAPQADAEAAGDVAEQESVQPGEPGPQRGLWAMMGRESDSGDDEPHTAAGVAEPETPPDEPAAEDATTATAPKGLWSLMQPETGGQESGVRSQESAGTTHYSPLTTQDELEVAPLEELAEDETTEPPFGEPPAVAAPAVTAVRSRGAMRALVLGIVAVPLSALALLPEFWLRLPGVIVGFLALMVGLLAFGEIRRSRGRQRGTRLAGTGMALGALGMLLGPLVFSAVGTMLREKFGRHRTWENLTVVGDAVTQYRRDHDRFPPGTTYRRRKNGDVALHNWMTHLLPYMGEDDAALYQRIDLQQPWDAEDNRGPLSENVTAFFASGSSRTKTATGMAVTHFVAVGGGGVLDSGSRVSADDVTDGLGQTIIAGEIAYDFPGWGRPEQSRQFGKGLNASRDGFGNADRTGAMFLKADGSVKFLSNRIAPDVLRQLGTYDGRESVDRSVLE